MFSHFTTEGIRSPEAFQSADAASMENCVETCATRETLLVIGTTIVSRKSALPRSFCTMSAGRTFDPPPDAYGEIDEHDFASFHLRRGSRSL
jgi:hypothetical protein